jgi:hypothetical protein
VVNLLKSKTIWFSIILAVGGALEQYSAVITSIVGSQNSGLVMLGISVVVAVLRVITTQPLSEK